MRYHIRACQSRGSWRKAVRVILEWWQYLLLTFAGAAAGFIDAIAGGGGLITVPALLSKLPGITMVAAFVPRMFDLTTVDPARKTVSL